MLYIDEAPAAVIAVPVAKLLSVWTAFGEVPLDIVADLCTRSYDGRTSLEGPIASSR